MFDNLSIRFKIKFVKNINFFISRLVIKDVIPYIMLCSEVVCLLEEHGVCVFSKLTYLHKSTRKKIQIHLSAFRFLTYIILHLIW